MKPSTRSELIEYCMRNLGAPVLDINVDEDQVEDRIDEALQVFQEYHSDAITPIYYRHIVEQEDIDNRWIPINDGITSVQSVLPLSSIGQSSSHLNMFDIRYQLALNDLFNIGLIGELANYYQTKQYIELLSEVMNPMPRIKFNRHMNRLDLYVNWNDVKVGDSLIIQCQQIVDPELYADVYNDMFLKRYATALIKRQWGVNLKKFEGITLPGGVTLNGQIIYTEASEEIKSIEEEMQLKYEYPPMFSVA